MPLLASRLLRWYAKNARPLPWRGAASPYAVWVSEVMLQQTRVDAVRPYYVRWMRRFPNIKALAAASEREVLQQWEGLGYYSRARNLRLAAQVLRRQHGGRLPTSVAALRALPGIGRSTAGAIASIAFGQDEPILDGNVRRVLARLFDIDDRIDSPQGERRLWRLAAQHLPVGRAGDFNQGLMDLGAMICIPTTPRCADCPASGLCLARRNGTVASRPIRRRKAPVPSRVLATAAVVRNGRVLLAQNPGVGLLARMWEFPGGAVLGDPAAGLKAALWKGYRLRVRREGSLTVVAHAYSHLRVTVHAFRCALVAGSSSRHLKWVSLRALDEYPMGKVDRQVARRLIESL